MPDEPSKLKSGPHQKDRAWLAGGLNAAEHLGIRDWPSLEKNLTDAIGYPGRTHLVRGFYHKSLRGGEQRARELRLGHAWLVDIDCDLYTSTLEALDFLVAARVLKRGTFLYYDDISWEAWHSASPPVEEKLAHIRFAKKHGLKWRLLPRSPREQTLHRGGKAIPLHWRPVFLLESCGVNGNATCDAPSDGSSPCGTT
jgi:hypothetical protein